MKNELNDNELEMVSGGETIIQSNDNKVLFTTILKKRTFQNCTLNEISLFVNQLLDANPNLSEQEFDELAMSELIKKGWINA
ncbi:MAG: hypothetical protein KBT31_02815 [Firmicutes bacterium]|nr:hypothetical protein [Candidatus Colimorpha enterica]